MDRSNRRNFLKKAAVGGAAAGAAIATAGFTRRIEGQGKDFKRIYYRDLGSTGFKVSEVGFGCMNMRDPELVTAAIDNGINYIDTAHSYMQGVNEEIVGSVMKTMRGKVFLTTKLKQAGPEKLPDMLALSLKRLQTDHVDLLLLHIVESREQALNQDYMAAFESFREKGMARFIGLSTHKNQAEVLDAAVESKLWDAVLVGYNFTSPPEVGKAIERARNAGLATIAMKMMIAIDSRKPLEAPAELKKGGFNAAQACLRWVLQNRFVDTTVPGMTSFEHLAQDMAVMGTRMGFFDRRTLTRYAGFREGGACRGVAGCDGCAGQCPFGVDVRDLNRCVGYAHGYGNIELARENYRELPHSSKIEVCADCGECLVKCAHGIDLTATVRQARTLFG
jgi:uncharacterized protein